MVFPYGVYEIPLSDQKFGVWISISRRRIVGPIFFAEIINSDRYYEIIHNFMRELTEDEINFQL